MPSRREFVKRASAAVAAALAPVQIIQAEGSRAKTKPAVIFRAVSAALRQETIVRHGGNADIFPLTWMSDSRQFGSFSDGFGWSPSPKKNYNTRALWVEGDPINASFHEADVYPDPTPKDGTKAPRYYGFSTLAVDDRIYQTFCFLKKSSNSALTWNGVKVIHSLDQGRSWRNQHGSTSVVWESYADQSRENMLFLDEPQDAFSLMSFLQMGQNYEMNQDGYVYGYGTNGNTDGTMNELVMFRVPKLHVLDRTAYEFFDGMKSNGTAGWAKDILGRAVVHTFPRGWVNRPRKDEGVVQAWLPSVVYNAPLGIYLMASSGVGCHADGDWFGNSKPSYLGFWTAPNPWGPWAQIHEETAWTPGNDIAARCYSPQIAPKWIAPDGKSFWLVWSDFQGVMEHSAELVRRAKEIEAMSPSERLWSQSEIFRRHAPYYSFNTQRVDLVIS